MTSLTPEESQLVWSCYPPNSPGWGDATRDFAARARERGRDPAAEFGIDETSPDRCGATRLYANEEHGCIAWFSIILATRPAPDDRPICACVVTVEKMDAPHVSVEEAKEAIEVFTAHLGARVLIGNRRHLRRSRVRRATFQFDYKVFPKGESIS